MACFIRILAAVGVFALSACYNHTYVVPGTYPSSTPNYERWHHHFIAGLVTVSDDVDLRAVCPAGIAKIEDEHSFLNWLVGAITFSIYTPTEVSVYCAAPTPIMVPVGPSPASPQPYYQAPPQPNPAQPQSAPPATPQSTPQPAQPQGAPGQPHSVRIRANKAMVARLRAQFPNLDADLSVALARSDAGTPSFARSSTARRTF